jgi:hypothetical protein
MQMSRYLLGLAYEVGANMVRSALISCLLHAWAAREATPFWKDLFASSVIIRA